MANKKISELAVAGTLDGTEAVEIVQGGQNVQTTTQDIADLGGGGGTWGSITGTLSDQSDLQTALDSKATLASPALTGNPTAPTPSAGDNDTSIATTAFVRTEVVGVQDLYYPAKGILPRLTGGCQAPTQYEFSTSLANLIGLAFDKDTQEFAQMEIVPPRKYNNGSFTVTPVWTAISGSGTVQWGISAVSLRNDDALTTAFGTAQTSDDTLIATNDLHIAPDTSAITAAGTVQDGNLMIIQISRNVASDNLSADAILLGLWIHWTTDAAKDA